MTTPCSYPLLVCNCSHTNTEHCHLPVSLANAHIRVKPATLMMKDNWNMKQVKSWTIAHKYTFHLRPVVLCQTIIINTVTWRTEHCKRKPMTLTCTSSFVHVQEPHTCPPKQVACGEGAQEKEARHPEGQPRTPSDGEERAKTQGTQPQPATLPWRTWVSETGT